MVCLNNPQEVNYILIYETAEGSTQFQVSTGYSHERSQKTQEASLNLLLEGAEILYQNPDATREDALDVLSQCPSTRKQAEGLISRLKAKQLQTS